MLTCCLIHDTTTLAQDKHEPDASDLTYISFHLTTQFLWEYSLFDLGPGQADTSTNRLIFRRIRPVVSGNVITSDLLFLMQLNVVPGALEMLDFWIDYRFSPQLRLRLGQQKIPYTRHRLNSFRDLSLVDWSYPTRYFGAERQIGVMLHNGLNQPDRFEFQLGVFTGVNERASNGIGYPLLYASNIPNPSNLANPDPLGNIHTELVLHAAYNHNDIDVRKSTDFEGGPARMSTGISLAWDLKPTQMKDHLLRIAGEVGFRAVGFACDALLQLSLFEPVESGTGPRLGLFSSLLEASYLFGFKHEISLRYTHVSVLEALRIDIRKQTQNASLEAEHELGVGYNLHLLENTLKWQTDFAVLIHQHSSYRLDDYRLRCQLQLSF